MEEILEYTPQDIQENKLWAFLGYLGILLLIPLLAKKDSPFAQFHAKQGLVLLLAGIALSIVSIVPILGWIAGIIGSIVIFVLWVIGIINVLSGKASELPLLGKYAHNLNI